MSLFSSTPKAAQAETPSAVKNLTVQQSCQGAAIPVVYGTTKLSGNLLWYGDFAAIPHTETTSGGGGKGGGGGGASSTTTSYSYRTSFAFALAAGEIVDVARIWWGKTQYDLATLPGSVTLKTGAPGQSPWSYLASLHPDQALGYSGLAHVGVADADLGSSTSLPNILYEVLGKGPAAATTALALSHTLNLAPLAGPWSAPVAAIAARLPDPPATGTQVAFDTSPAFCLYDLLVDSDYGVGMPEAMVADLSDYASWCRALGLTMSVALTEAAAANRVIAPWLQTTLAEAVWSNGTLKVIPYADAPVLASDGVTPLYAPDLTPVMSIDDGMMLADGDQPPLTVTRADPADASNRISVEYLNRSFAYNTAVAVAEDPAHIARYGRRDASVITAHHFAQAAVAQTAADRLCDRSVAVLASYRWRMGPKAALLEPMDLVRLTDPAQGLSGHLVRLTEIEEEGDSVFTVTAEDVPGASLAMGEQRPLQAALGFVADVNADAGPINAPVLFEPPDALTSDGLELWAAVSGGPLWAGAEVWVSLDGDGYRKVGTVTAPARQGTLAATLLAGADIDRGHALCVDLGVSRGELASVSEIDAAALATLSYVDGELIAYETATLTASHQYVLTDLRRGLYGTDNRVHAAGAAFARLDGAIFKYPFTADYIGRTLLLKFVSFNVFGGGLEDIADVEPYSYTLRGTALASPLPDVEGLTTAFVAGITNLTWQAVTDFRDFDYEVRQGETPSVARVIGRTTLTQASAFGDGTYWVAAHYRIPNGQDVYSENWAGVAIAGAALVANVVADHDEAATGWSGTRDGVVAVGNILRNPGAGDIALADDVAAIGDMANYGGVAPSGTYTVPDSHRIDVGRVVASSVQMTVTAAGVSVGDDISTVADIAALTDIAGAALGVSISARPQLRTSQDGAAWGDWADWIPGTYSARVFDFRVLLATGDTQVIPELSAFSIQVDVPDRVETYTGVACPAEGLILAYGAPFNGGPGDSALPHVQVTVVDEQPGDTLVFVAQNRSGLTLRIDQGGIGVVRVLNVIVQGY